MSDNSISHNDFQEKYGGEVIPYNFDEGPHNGIKCPECEVVSDEDEWDWVNTIAYDVDDSFDFEVHGVTVACPECEAETTFR